LLGDFLGVRGGKDAGEASVSERVGERVQKVGDGVRETHGS